MKLPTPTAPYKSSRRSPIIFHVTLLGLAAAVFYFGLYFLKSRLVGLHVPDKSWPCSVVYSCDGMYATFVALGLCVSTVPQASLVDQYVTKEYPIAIAGMLANIGPDGSRASGAAPGIVIASPSTEDPNYLYTWIRDSSLVFKVLIDQYTLGGDTSLGGLIDDFVAAETTLQHVSNPSGNVSTGGLGEPKFYINMTAFMGSWGRPQRDGPALRATALITYANWLIDKYNYSYVIEKVWPVVKLDVDYVADKWNMTGFDLWEEVSSSSFFTSTVQHRALREGVALAEKLGHTEAISEWTTQADNVLCFIQSYDWNPLNSYITANTLGGRSGIDSNTILASIHTFDPAAGCDASTFQPCSDKALASLKVYVDSFRSIYSINGGIAAGSPVATGRYPEDVYYNGNPWYLTTAAVAEQLYDSLTVWKLQASLTITEVSLPFFSQFLPSVELGTYDSFTWTYATLLSVIEDHADGFLAVMAKYTPDDGGLAEQYNKNTGVPLSARHLTWSYASALTVFAARNGTVPASWGAQGLEVPALCKSNPGPVVNVTFNLVAETVFGENIYVTGSMDRLKYWSPDNAVSLSAAGYPTWSVTLEIPASTAFEYKYIRKHDGEVTWEADPNRDASTPATGWLILNDKWH